MERLSALSFVRNGHAFHLYTYGTLRGAPPEVVLRDANEVIPSHCIFRDSRNGLSTFSNYFRYKLLLDRGGWWVDADIVCLAPFGTRGEHLFAVEPDHTIATAVIRAPAGSDIMARAWEECLQVGMVDVPWGLTGPELLGRLVHEMGQREIETDPSIFFPIDWPDWQDLIKPGPPPQLPSHTRAIHLWNSMWVLEGADKDAQYPSDCLYEELKSKYFDA